jgi:dinuclear metal center YbgI/SA1388 family protein
MAVPLQDLTVALKQIAPLELAEEWDNVGLLMEPSRPRPVRRLLLTIDLTDAVLDEAIRLKSDMIVAYHPPIFEPIKRLTHVTFNQAAWRAVRCIEAGIAVYSPHTALDAVPGGVNDWLSQGLGPISRKSAWTKASHQPVHEAFKIVVFVPLEAADRLRTALADCGAGRIGDYRECSFNLQGTGTFMGGPSTRPAVGSKGRLEHIHEVRIEMVCSKTGLPNLIEAIREHHPYEEPAWDIYKLEPKPMRDTGQGRLIYLKRKTPLPELVRRIKRHLGVDLLRVAGPRDMLSGRRPIDEVAVCAGAGGSLFKGTLFQVYLTGEMRHHDILAKVEQGSAVILADHTNTERGYLPVLKKKLHERLGRLLRIDISKADREPMKIV